MFYFENQKSEKTRKTDSIKITYIKAFDERGNLYNKEIRYIIRNDSKYGDILKFGGIGYHVNDILKYEPKSYPYDKCIDAGGRNHNYHGSAVYIKKEHMNEIIPCVKQIIKLLESQNIDEKGYITIDNCQKCGCSYLQLENNKLVIKCICI